MFKAIPFRRTREIITRTQHSLLYEATLGVLAILSIVFLGYEFLGNPSASTLSILLSFDLTVAWIFLTDFVIGFSVDKDRDTYAKQNWLNLLSSVPISAEASRTLRILRIIRSLRIIRGLAVVSNIQRAKNVMAKALHKKS
ncbi:MAG: ion transporter [Candidatus Paceibacterota bacterium]